jgi:hypothetical protein
MLRQSRDHWVVVVAVVEEVESAAAVDVTVEITAVRQLAE